MPPNVQGVSPEPQPQSAQEKKEVYYNGYFYDVTDWIRKHPGGNIIKFYTKQGEDASLAIQEFHNRSTKKVLSIMSSLKKRPATPKDLGLDSETTKRHEALTRDFQELRKELEREGFFKPHIPHVIYRISELIFFLCLGLYLLCTPQTFLVRGLGIFCLAMFQGRCGWLMHEGGHHSLTGKPNVDRLLQAIIYGCGDGMSSSWWSSQHNRHHAMPQRLQHDVDLDTMPLLAFNKDVVKNKKHGQGFFIQHQSTLFLSMDCLLVAIFWKLYLHPRYVITKGTYIQQLFMGLHYLVAYNVGIVTYLVTVWLAAIYIFGNFALSHTHLPVTEKPLHWVEFALLHTMDIQPSWWCDWWMAYLNYQIEHHLFPTMPQFRHPKVRGRVLELAKKHDIPYHCTSYVDAWGKTFQNLADVSKDLRHGI